MNNWLVAWNSRSEDLTSEDDKGTGNKIRVMLRKKYQELGPMSYHESTVLVLFVILISLWMFRDPKFVPGWGSLFSKYRSFAFDFSVGSVWFYFKCSPGKSEILYQFYWLFSSCSSCRPSWISGASHLHPLGNRRRPTKLCSTGPTSSRGSRGVWSFFSVLTDPIDFSFTHFNESIF